MSAYGEGNVASVTEPPDDLLLPDGARLLHIGPQKTGTTALQAAMHGARARLREHGVVYPGNGMRPREGVWAALGTDVPKAALRRPARIALWHRLVGEVENAGDLRVCVSTEDFAKAEEDGARKVVRELGGERSHVVAAVRRLDKLLPSQWQQRVKMGSTLSYDQWLAVVLGEDSNHPMWRNIWIPHDVEGLVNRWTRIVGDDRFTLIVYEEDDQQLIPDTFERMLGLPRGVLSTENAPRRNESLSFDRLELIRRLNHAFENAGWGEELVEGDLRVWLVNQLKSLAPSTTRIPVPPLPPWAADRVEELNVQRAKLIRELGVRVVGDPDLLRAPAGLSDETPAESLTVPVQLAGDAIEKTITHLVELQEEKEAEHERTVRDLRRRLRSERTQAAAPGARSGGGRPVDEIRTRELARTLIRRVAQRIRRR